VVSHEVVDRAGRRSSPLDPASATVASEEDGRRLRLSGPSTLVPTAGDAHAEGVTEGTRDMTTRTVDEERRSGFRLVVIGLVVLAAMLGLWWLIVTTNSEGDPGDPYLLPIFGLVPLAFGLYRVLHARSRRPHSSRPA